MIRCEDFVEWLEALGVDFYAGVPDSLLKPVCFYLADHVGDRHVVAANEGGAVALACGHHLATGNVPLVYLQNSGQGNTINPLLSLADREVYSIGEYWATPSEFLARSGDCEDYVIAKFFALRELGFANQELRIAVVYDNLRRIGHPVLAVYTEGDILILNNQTDTIASHARYDNFVPWYLVNETTMWTTAGPALSALVPELSVDRPSAGAKAGARAILGAQTRRPGAG